MVRPAVIPPNPALWWSDLPPVAPFDALRVRLVYAHYHRVGPTWNGSILHSGDDRLYFVTGGAGELRAGRAQVSLVSGVCCLIPAFTAFSYRCDRSVTFWWAQFVTRIAGDRPLFGVAPGLHARPVDRRRTVQEFSALYAACRADHGAAALRRSAAILRLLEPFADLVHAEDPPEQARFAAAVERMERLGPPPRIAELARACGLSTAHFSRRFTAAFGQPPARYLLHCRLEQARRMLAEGGRTIDAIARRCGFCDGFHLSRLFRKHLGTTPSRYRERPVRPGW